MTDLEERCESTHAIMESDISPYLDKNNQDRSPFYKFKGDTIMRMNALEK